MDRLRSLEVGDITLIEVEIERIALGQETHRTASGREFGVIAPFGVQSAAMRHLPAPRGTEAERSRAPALREV